MRCEQSKLTTVKALQSMGFDTIASGDSFNDLAMIEAGKKGFLFDSLGCTHNYLSVAHKGRNPLPGLSPKGSKKRTCFSLRGHYTIAPAMVYWHRRRFPRSGEAVVPIFV